MKRKIEGIIVCTLVIATALPAVGIINKNIASLLPSEIEWMKIYGGEEFNWLFDIEETDDGDIAAGVFEYQERHCAWLLKIDEMGNQQWSAINDLWYGLSPGQDDITIECVRQINGGYIVGGFGLYYNALHDCWASAGHLWKVNSTGGTEWLKVLVSDEEDWSFCPMGIELENDGFICGGWYVKAAARVLDKAILSI